MLRFLPDRATKRTGKSPDEFCLSLTSAEAVRLLSIRI